MIGQRVWPDQYGILRLPDGGYGQDMKGRWNVRPPGGTTGELDGHEVVEHADETITVSPSIDGTDCGQGHWRLERGIWSSCDPATEQTLANVRGTAEQLLNRAKGVSK